MENAWYQMLLIFMFFHLCISMNAQTNGTTDITSSEEQYETTQESQDVSQEKSTKSFTNSGNNLISNEISSLLQYHDNFQTKKYSTQDLQFIAGKLGNNNSRHENSERTGKVPDHVHSSHFPNDASNFQNRPTQSLNVQNRPTQSFTSNISPSYSAPLLTRPTTEDYRQIQNQFAFRPSNTSSYSQVPAFNQNAGYNDYLNQLSLYHILNNYRQKQQSTTPVPAPAPTPAAPITLAIQVTSRPTPPPIDENNYANIAYIPAIHGTQLQGLFGATPPGPPPAGPPAPPPGPFSITSLGGGAASVLAPGVPDSGISAENAVLNTPGVTSTTIANCLTGKLCSFLLASLIAAGTTGALALPVAWPFLGAFFGRRKRDAEFGNPTHKFLNDHNIPTWIMELYKQINHSDILYNESLTKFLGTSGIPQHLNFDDVIKSSENLYKYLDMIKENEAPVMDIKYPLTENAINNIDSEKVPATLSMPPKMNYRNKPIKIVVKKETLNENNAFYKDNKMNIPPLDTNSLIHKICTVIDHNTLPYNVFVNYITQQCSLLYKHVKV